MAKIDIKEVTIRLQDGHSNSGFVDGITDTPANGDSHLFVKSLATALKIPISTEFRIAGVNQRYFVTVSTGGTNEIQDLEIGTATGGTYILKFDGVAGATLAYDANAATIEATLEAITGIGVDNVVVAGTAPSFTITFERKLGGQVIASRLTADFTGLTGGSGESLSVSTPGVNDPTLTDYIEFTPALLTGAGIPSDNAALTFLGRTVEAEIGDGDFTYNEQRNLDVNLDRGKFKSVSLGDEIPIDVTLTYTWEFLTTYDPNDTSQSPTMEEALKQEGPADVWETTTTDPCEPYAINIELENAPDCSSEPWELILLKNFRWSSLDHSLSDGQVTVTGICGVTRAQFERLLAVTT